MSLKTSSSAGQVSLNERIYQEAPVIGGVRVRPFNTRVKMKIAALLRMTGVEDQFDEESFFAALYLIAAPLERVALNTLNSTAYLTDREKFFAELPETEFTRLVEWIHEVRTLERETEIEVHAKPSAATGETPPPN